MRETYLILDKKYIEYVEKNGHPNVGGSLYKVRLRDQYLYRDKPLSEQPKYVQERLAKMIFADAERNQLFMVLMTVNHALQREG